MKMLTLWQPWASLIAIGAKAVETRSWATDYRGPLAIHAAKRRTNPHEITPEIRAALVGSGIFEVEQMPFGAVVCLCELTDVLPIGEVVDRLDADELERETAFGDFSPGRYGWILSDIDRLAHPVYVAGQRGLAKASRALIDTLAIVPSAPVGSRP